MSIALNALSAALARLGPADVYVGDPMNAGMMAFLGQLEGERRAEVEYAENNLTLEQTGGIPHDKRVTLTKAEVHVKIALNALGAAIWAKINPLGLTGGGSTYPKPVVTTSVLLIPHAELGAALAYTGGQWVRTAGNGYAGVSGAGAAPVHAFWLWKASARHGNIPYVYENGGKSEVDAVFSGMLDVTKPDGYMVYDIGDPRAHGINVVL